MTNDTKNRIRAYMQELPHMKEKVFGALLMLVIAATVVVASTYAWVTLSRSPEVTTISTTLAANGALEIALSKPNGDMPDEFDIDESSEGNSSVVVSNLQWGNLVNLSDPTYGIDNISLRPAQLNDGSLLYNPLWGADYGDDGRIGILNTNYTYTKYLNGQFIASSDYGVRAISSYTMKTSNSTLQDLTDKLDAVASAQRQVANQYSKVIARFATLGELISRVAQDKVNETEYAPSDHDGTDSDLASFLPKLRNLYKELKKAMDLQKDAYVALANLQRYQWTKSQSDMVFTPISWGELENNPQRYDAESAADEAISLTGLRQFVLDYAILNEDLAYLETYTANYELKNTAYHWDHGGEENYDVVDMINRLISYSTMYLVIDGEPVGVGSIASKAESLVLSPADYYDVYVTTGLLMRFEQSALSEADRMYGSDKNKAQCNISVTASAKGITDTTLVVSGHAHTEATGLSYFAQDLAAAQGNTLDLTDAVAEDTYGLAIDLWVRTNAEETCLILEGATSTDEQGNVVRYDGVNRIWGSTGEAVLTTDSTTQGGGSCYIYYADSPEDTLRSIELLKAMKVVFISSTGELLATAEMDIDNYWAVNGRITVPLVLDNQSKTTYTYTDIVKGEQIGYAITTLYTDVPVRVTAIVYLDGNLLSNNQVLSAAEVQGSLNIQFGSSVELKTVGSNELIDDTRVVTATVSPDELDYDSDEWEYNRSTRVTVKVEGEGSEPTTVTAFFVRAINSTQGTRERTMTFTKEGDFWVCDYEFSAPGTYYLRQVRLDGIDYTLSDPQMVEIRGFGLTSVEWGAPGNNESVLTSENSYSTTVTVKFSSDERDKRPASVYAVFVRSSDVSSVTVPLTYTKDGWVGTATFTASGEYKLRHLDVDGNYIDLALNDESYRTLDLSLGMYVKVESLTGGFEDTYDPDKEKELYHKDVAVHIYNNAGAELTGLSGLRLYYSVNGSATNTRDANLVWSEAGSRYIGTLPIEDPGRYQFLWVTMGGSAESTSLDKCSGTPPVYVLRSPYAPEYIKEDSNCTKNDENGVQFVPLSRDAKIDGIVIEYAAPASSAVVYSSESREYYTVPLQYGNNSWYVNLPTYNGAQTGVDAEGNPIYVQEQEGKWSLVAIRLWDCYDGNSVDVRGEDNPVLWVDSVLGRDYLRTLVDENGNAISVTPDKYQDFSQLVTIVSTEVNVTMNGGSINLGGTNIPFGRAFQPADTQMSVTLTDGNGNIIPADKVESVVLSLTYSGNTDLRYGYLSNHGGEYTIELNSQDAETGERTISKVNSSWIYVGKYVVESLSVKIRGVENPLNYTYRSEIGVPESYTLTTAAPTEDNIDWETITVQPGQTEFTGKFLSTFDLGNTSVRISLIGESGKMSNAVYEGLNARLILAYQGGSEELGGYSFARGTTAHENLSLAMNQKTAGSGTYTAPSHILLAGTYAAEVQVTAGSRTESFKFSKDITVRSTLPDVTMQLTAETPESVTVSKSGAAIINPDDESLVFDGTNMILSNGHTAVVYMQYESGLVNSAGWRHGSSCGVEDSAPPLVEHYANYTAPQLIFTLDDVGANATLIIPGNESTVNWSSNAKQATATIGKVVVGEETNGDHEYSMILGLMTNVCKYYYTTEKATSVGTVIIDTITSEVEGVTYTRSLATPLIISQLTQENPTLTWDANGVDIKVTHGGYTYTGTAEIPMMTSVTATVTAKNGYHHPKLSEPEGVFNWVKVSEGENEAVYTFTMSVGNATLSGSATKYPAITFNSGNNATVVTKVNGTIVSNNTGAKAGARVEVTVTSEGNYCLPVLKQPAAVSDWAKDEAKSNDFKTVYTFTMPNQAVSLSVPTTTAMAKLDWGINSALTFYVEDSSGRLENGGYVVPGHKVTVSLTATGGMNPTLEKISGIENWTSNEGAYVSTYTFTMPSSAVTLTGLAEAYPALKLDNNYAAFTVSDDGIIREYEPGKGVSIKPGNTVTVALTAKDGWYAPRMSNPGIDSWTMVGEPNNQQAVYTFTMPDGAVDVTSYFTATEAPAVNVTLSNSTLSMSYTDYAGTLHTDVGSGTKVQPGVVVTITVKAVGNYYKPTVSGATFTYDSGADYDTRTYKFTMGDSTVALSASTTAYPTIILEKTDKGGTLTINGTSVGSSGVQVKPGTTVQYSVSFDGANDRKITIQNTDTGTNVVAPISDITESPKTGSFTMPDGNVKIIVNSKASSSGACVTEDTLVTLADGTQVRIDSLTGDELLLVWNLETGSLDCAPIMFVDSEARGEYEVIHLYFSDGTEVKAISEHGFWDYELGRYIYLDKEAAQYIGHSFAKEVDGELERVILTDVVVRNETTSAWSPVTVGHLCYFVNDMLSMPGGVGGLFNIFDVDVATMSYDLTAIAEDIATYGLFTYEEMNAIVPLSRDMFEAAGGAYLKVSIGKGNLTMDELVYMIERYSVFFD